MDDEKLTKVSMNIILYAGDAKNNVHQAMKLVKEKNIDEALKALDEAEANLVVAHKSQTEIIQSACSGEKYEYNILFAHAMDTLMTIQSEYEIARDLIEIFKEYQ